MTKPYYQDDLITIIHGDCREVLIGMNVGSIDLVLTDPPYDSLNEQVAKGSTTRLILPHSENAKQWFSTLGPEELQRVFLMCQENLKVTGALYVFADVKSGLKIFPYLNVANVIVWDKGHLGMGYNWRRMHEWIAYIPQAEHKLRDKGLGDVQRYSGVNSKDHPTQKPVSLLKVIIRNSTDEGQIVLDPFMGTGSTLRACKDMGRRCIGIEIDESYCETAANKMAQFAQSL